MANTSLLTKFSISRKQQLLETFEAKFNFIQK
jgi:hypothetical protein